MNSGWKNISVFALAGLALASLGGCSKSGGEPAAAKLTEVAQAAAREEDRVEPLELARWLVEEKGDLLLVDVRSAEAYQAGHIGEARNIPLAMLGDPANLADLPGNRKVIVYADRTENSAKASVILRLQGLNAHLLVGGYKGWNAQVLNPDIPAQAMPGESQEVAERRALSCYFVGERSESSGEAQPLEMPRFEPPVLEQDQVLDPGKRPKAEGC